MSGLLLWIAELELNESLFAASETKANAHTINLFKFYIIVFIYVSYTIYDTPRKCPSVLPILNAFHWRILNINVDVGFDNGLKYCNTILHEEIVSNTGLTAKILDVIQTQIQLNFFICIKHFTCFCIKINIWKVIHVWIKKKLLIRISIHLRLLYLYIN